MISPDLSLIISCMNANDLFVNNSNRYVLDGVNILLKSFSNLYWKGDCYTSYVPRV
jgi:hypothetical protein